MRYFFSINLHGPIHDREPIKDLKDLTVFS